MCELEGIGANQLASVIIMKWEIYIQSKGRVGRYIIKNITHTLSTMRIVFKNVFYVI